MAKHKGLPKILYATVEKEREPEDDFIIASGDISELSESETTVVVGKYKWVESVNLVNKTEIGN